ncbi:MAG: phosphodiester glycosidase family protein [Acidobacteria bacterium]|nr:phosphodiester glycosidase family protein [Acidobacteriota bacterium]
MRINKAVMDLRVIRGVFQRAALCLICLCALCGQSKAQDWQTLKPGVEYAQVTKEISGLKVNMNLLRLDLTKVRLDVVHAFDKAIGVDTPSNIAKTHRAFAAINAGFFRLDTSQWLGEDVGALVVNHHLLSESHEKRIALLINNHLRTTETIIGHLNLNCTIVVGKYDFPGRGINRQRGDYEMVAYTPAFGPSTLTSAGGLEVVVANRRVVSINNASGNSMIPRNGFVVSAGKGVGDMMLQPAARLGAFSFLRIAYNELKSSQRGPILYNERYEDVVSGVPQLIRNGKIDITWQEEKVSKSFVETRHPRTAVAKLKDGKFLMITVDGRSESSGGIGLQDLAEYLLSLGAVDAMNLDGGGSTTMWIDGKGVVNHPSDKEGERKVSDALLVTLRRPK